MRPMIKKAHSLHLRALSAAFLALGALASAPQALAESPPREDVDNGPSVYNSYWQGNIPSGDFIGVSTDATLPLPITLSLNDNSVISDTLAFVDVRVIPMADPNAEPVAGSLTYSAEHGLVLWTPTAPLQPSTAYAVDVLVNNEGMRGLGIHDVPNIEGGFDITTSAAVLTTSPPALSADPSVTFTSVESFAGCPPGEIICDDGPVIIDGDGRSTGGQCRSGVVFFSERAVFEITWGDGEAAGEELFYVYDVTVAGEAFYNIHGATTLQSTHSRSLEVPLLVLSGDEVCIAIQATDLRSIARGSADGTTTTTHCVTLVDKPPITDPALLLADCEPGPTTGEDVDPFDAFSGGDTTNGGSTGEDTGESAGSDAATNPSANPGDDDGCGCTTTRTPQGQPPAGLLLGLAGAFGVALRRRSRRSRG